MSKPSFDKANTGLRKRGEKSGARSLWVVAGEEVEAYWSVKDADAIQVLLGAMPASAPRRLSDPPEALLIGPLEPGVYAVKLVAGVANGPVEEWFDEGAVDLKLTVQPFAVTSFRADPEPDDDKDHPPHDLQLAAGHKLKLHWETIGATKVSILAEPGGLTDHDGGRGELVVDPMGQSTVYKITASNGTSHSRPGPKVSVHFHDPADHVSPLALVHKPARARLDAVRLDEGAKPGKQVVAGAGEIVKLSWEVAGARSAQLRGGKQRVDLPLEANAGAGVVTVSPAASTGYSLVVQPLDPKAKPVEARAQVEIASFNVQLLHFDGTPAAEQYCELAIPGQAAPGTATTSKLGVLLMGAPAAGAAGATLRLFKDAELEASWRLDLVRQAAAKNKLQIQLGKRKTLRPAPWDHPRVREALQLHARYLAAIPADSEEAVQQVYLAQWTRGLMKTPRLAELINGSDLELFELQYAQQHAAKADACNALANALIELLEQPELVAVLNQLGQLGAALRSVLIQGLGESPPGRAWLSRQAELFFAPFKGAEPTRPELEEEKRGFLALVAQYDTKEGAEALFDRTDDLATIFSSFNPWLEALAECSAPFVRLRHEQAVVQFAGVLTARFGPGAVKLISESHLIPRGLSAQPFEFKVDVLHVEVTPSLHATAKVLGAIEKVATVLNIAVRVNLFLRDPSAQNFLESSGGLLELLGIVSKSFDEGVTHEMKKVIQSLSRAGRNVSDDGLPKAVAGAAGEAAVEESVGKAVSGAFKESAGGIAVLVGIVDTISFSLDAAKAWDKGDKWAFRGNAIGAVGAAMTVVGGAMLLSPAAPLGLALFIAGSIVTLVGELVGSLLEMSELEEWAAHSRFGIRTGEDAAYAKWPDNYPLQIEELKKAIYLAPVRGFFEREAVGHAEAYGKLWSYSAHILVEPTLFSELSALDLDIDGKGEMQDGPSASRVVAETFWSGDVKEGSRPGPRGNAAIVEVEYEKELQAAENWRAPVESFFEGGAPRRVKRIKLRVDLGQSYADVEKMTVTLRLRHDGPGAEPVVRTGEISAWRMTIDEPLRVEAWGGR